MHDYRKEEKYATAAIYFINFEMVSNHDRVERWLIQYDSGVKGENCHLDRAMSMRWVGNTDATIIYFQNNPWCNGQSESYNNITDCPSYFSAHHYGTIHTNMHFLAI